MVWLRAKEDISAMYGGRIYSWKAGEHKPVEEEAAQHLLKKPLLEVVDGPAPEVPTEPVVCPLCDKDFSQAAKPEYSVLQHIRAAHGPQSKAELEVLAEEETAAEVKAKKEPRSRKERLILNPEE